MPVRVRNLSTTGALVEGADVPPVGTRIILRRGTLEAAGSVAWAGTGKAGLTFPQPLSVSCWLPAKAAGTRARVDQAINETRLSKATLVAELSAVQAQLGQLGGQLARYSSLVPHRADPQLLVAAEQRIAHLLSALLAADDKVASPSPCFPF